MAELARRVRRIRRHTRRRIRRWRARLRLRVSYLRYSRWRRRGRWALWGAGAVLLLGVAWIVVTAFLARAQLRDVQNRLAQVRVLLSQGELQKAQRLARGIPSMTDRAQSLTSGPVWSLAAGLPYAGGPLKVVRATTAAAAELGSHAVPDLLAVVDDINPATLRTSADGINLTPLEQAGPKLAAAGTSLRTAIAGLRSGPGDTWLGPVNSARASFLLQLSLVDGYVDAANRASRVLPEMLGAHGATRRYFVALENEAEMRGTGGLTGGFAIVTAHDGTIKFTRFESDQALLPGATHQLIRTGLNFGRAYDALYGSSNPTSSFVDSNVSPNFPYAAQIWAAMWQKQTGQRLDGAIALDPTALSYFLAVTGPALVPSTSIEVSAANVVELTQQGAYALFPDYYQRKDFLKNVLRATADKLTSGASSAVGLAHAASLAAAQRRLLVWSRDPAVERLLDQTTYAGSVVAHGDPFSGLVLNNAAAGKLDYYLQRSVSYTRTGCGPLRDVGVTITLLNTAPASGLPTYVTTRLDADRPTNAKPGDSRSIVDYYATGGAVLQSVTLNGRRTSANVASIDGRTVVRLDLELPRAVTQTIEIHLQEPAMRGTPTMWIQPGVQPLDLQYFNQNCN